MHNVRRHFIDLFTPAELDTLAALNERVLHHLAEQSLPAEWGLGLRGMEIAVIGAGQVGRTLAAAWVRAGHQVAVGTRDPGSATVPAGAAVTEPLAALEEARVVVYAVPGSAMAEVLAAHTVALAGRIVIDATNNMAPDRTGPELSALRHLPDGVLGFRAFNSVGWENMADPVVGGEVADMFFAGPGNAAREVVGGLIADVGFRPVYAGDSPAAFAAVDSIAGLWFALALGRGYGRRLAFRVLTDSGSISSPRP